MSVVEKFTTACENVFSKYGRFVGAHPWWFIVSSIVVNGVLGVLLLGIQSVNDVEKVYVPTGNQAAKDRHAARTMFPDKSGTSFYPQHVIDDGKFGEVIFTSAVGSNILTGPVITEMAEISRKIKTFSFTDSNDSRVDFETACARLLGNCVVSGEFILKKEFLSDLNNNKVSYPDYNNGVQNVDLSLYLSGVGHTNGTLYAAKYLKLRYNLRQDTPQNTILSGQWEEEFLSQMSAMTTNTTLTDLAYAVSDSLNVELTENSGGDIMWFSLTFTLMITYASIVTSGGNCVSTKGFLSTAGVLAAGLGILAGFGVASRILPFSNIVGIMPFLVIGVGVDDAFILMSGWSENREAINIPDRVAATMRTSGMSITLTSLTDLVAFLIGMTSSFYSVKIFCLYAALAILFCYLNQVTLFAGCLALHGWRVKQNRHCATCMVVGSTGSKAAPVESLGSNSSDVLQKGKQETSVTQDSKGTNTVENSAFKPEHNITQKSIPTEAPDGEKPDSSSKLQQKASTVDTGTLASGNGKQDATKTAPIKNDAVVTTGNRKQDSNSKPDATAVPDNMRQGSAPKPEHRKPNIKETIELQQNMLTKDTDITAPDSTPKPNRLCLERLFCSGQPSQRPGDDENLFERVPRKFLPVLVLSIPGRVGIVLMLISYLSMSIYGVVHLRQGLELKNLIAPSSYFYEYTNWNTDHYQQRFLVTFFVSQSLAYNDDTNINTLENLFEGVKADSAIQDNFQISWMTTYQNSTFYDPSTKENFSGGLKKFLLHYPLFENDIRFGDNSSEITGSRFHFQTVDLPDSSQQGQFMIRMRDIASTSGISVFVYSPPFLYFEQYIAILPNTLQTVGVAVAAMFVLSVIFIPHPLMFVSITVSMVSTLTGILGFLYWWDLTLSSITMLHLVTATGFSVDYSAHICHAVMQNGKLGTSRQDVVSKALAATGGPILNGALSSFIGILFLAPSESYIFSSFFKVMLLVVLFGMAHSILFLPVFFSLFGPPGKTTSHSQDSVQREATNQ
ncbi:patched domain-containing protein 3-like [Liolophura sinensis]|uniref:patched domain-containing protein 3-like n=1 Tax=Liolophura sinensis TaxID=3198878 RepID=UPI003158A7FF